MTDTERNTQMAAERKGMPTKSAQKSRRTRLSPELRTAFDKLLAPWELALAKGKVDIRQKGFMEKAEEGTHLEERRELLDTLLGRLVGREDVDFEALYDALGDAIFTPGHESPVAALWSSAQDAL